MLYALICNDKPDSLDLRLKVRPDHVNYLSSLNENGTLKMAGPFLNGNGDACGSLVIIEAEDADEARQVADADPYATAGLFASVDIRPYNWIFNKPGA